MAIYYLDVRPVSRSAGRSATAAAAYRAGERIRDERRRQWFDHSGRRDVLHKEILLPSGLDGRDAGWARDRTALWNAAELAERQRNSRVAREYQVALPHELGELARIDLARAFSREIADRFQVAVDLAVHAPRPGGDPRNFHAHLLTTTRVVERGGLGAKTGLDMASVARRHQGLVGGIRELRAIREQWASLTNAALRAADLNARVDHRSLLAQGIERQPGAHLPWGAYREERRGLRSEIAERVREGYRRKVEARRVRLARTPEPGGRRPESPEQVRRLARENWLRYRDAGRSVQSTAYGERQAALDQAPKSPDDDYSL